MKHYVSSSQQIHEPTPLTPPLSPSDGVEAVVTHDIQADAYPVVFTSLQPEEGGGFLASFPDLPGCYSHGMTRAEALERSSGAVQLWAKAARERGLAVPKPNSAGDSSGHIRLRSPRVIQKRAQAMAKKAGVSLNSFVSSIVDDTLNVLYGIEPARPSVCKPEKDVNDELAWIDRDFATFAGEWAQRFDPELHHRLKYCAEEQGVSLNALISMLLAFGLGRLFGEALACENSVDSNYDNAA